MYDPYDSSRFRKAMRRQRIIDALKVLLVLAIIIIAVTIDGYLFPV